MDKQSSANVLRKAIDFARRIPLDTLGRLFDAVRGKAQPHPLLLPCSDTEQYECLAQLVELLATLPIEQRRDLMEQVYIKVKLIHTREKL